MPRTTTAILQKWRLTEGGIKPALIFANLLIKGICFYDVRTDLLALLCFNDNLANLRVAGETRLLRFWAVHTTVSLLSMF